MADGGHPVPVRDGFPLGMEARLRVLFLRMLGGDDGITIGTARYPFELQVLFQTVCRGFAEMQRGVCRTAAYHQRGTAAEQVVVFGQQVAGDEIGAAAVAEQQDIAFIDVVFAVYLFQQGAQIAGILFAIDAP